MILIRISDVIFVTQLVGMLQMFLVYVEKRMAMQPMFKQLVKRGKAHLPSLIGHTHRQRMALYNNEVGVRKHCLQKSCLEKIARGLFHPDGLALIPISFPALPEFQCVLRCQQG